MEDDGRIKDTEVNSQISTNAIELDTKTNDEIVQKQLMVRSYPSLKDLMDRKVTWKEFLGVYNVLRIAMLLFVQSSYVCSYSPSFGSSIRINAFPSAITPPRFNGIRLKFKL
eukprot:1060280_1